MGGFAMIIKIGYLHCYLVPDWVLARKTRPSEEVGSKRPDGVRRHESRFCLSVFVSNFVSSPASFLILAVVSWNMFALLRRNLIEVGTKYMVICLNWLCIRGLLCFKLEPKSWFPLIERIALLLKDVSEVCLHPRRLLLRSHLSLDIHHLVLAAKQTLMICKAESRFCLNVLWENVLSQ